MPTFGTLAPGDVGGALPEAYGADQPIMDPLVRMAKKAFYDVPKGLIDTARSTPYGLRRSDVTDIPGSAQPVDPLVRQSVGVASGMVGGPAIGPAEEGAALGSSAIRGQAIKKPFSEAFSGSPDQPPDTDVTTQPMSAPINWRRDRIGLGGIPVGDKVVVDAPTAALDAAHKATDPGMYVEAPKAQVRDYMQAGNPISLPDVSMYKGQLRYVNGRNRVAAARDMGAPTVPVAVDPDSVQAFKDLLAKHAPPDVTSPETSATVRFGSIAPQKQAEDDLLKNQKPSLLHRIHEAITLTPSGAAGAATGMVPGAGVADVMGYLPDYQGGTYPSFGQNIKAGRYGQAALQTANLAGDLMLATPAAPLGELAKGAATAIRDTPKTVAKAIADYSGGHAIAANKLLREGPEAFDEAYGAMGKNYRGQVEKTIGVMDRMAKPLPEDTTLYRSMPISPDAKPGDVVSTPGFSSTARTYGTPKAIADDRGETLVTIKAPQGSHAIDFGDKGMEKGEVVLPRDAQVKLTKVNPDGTAEAELQSSAPSTPAPQTAAQAAIQAKADRAAARAEKEASAQAKAEAFQQAKQQASQIANKYGPPGSNPNEEALTVNGILNPEGPPIKPRSRTVEEIAQMLQDRGQAALKNLGVEGGQINEPHPVHDELVARAMASEVKAAMDRSAGYGGKSAADWYTTSIDEAMKHAEDIWPELKNDPHQKMALTAAMAITSQGENVTNNVRLASEVYDHFRKTGRFPTDVEAQNKEVINGNFDKMNQLLDKLGPEGTRQFLHNDYTVKQLEQMGYDVGGENKSTVVKGSAILGPKIGGGFFQNLNGNYDPVTMDMWFMRAMGRLQGTLVGRPIEAPQARLEAAMRKEGMQVPNDPDRLEEIANQVRLAHEKDFRNNRDQYNSGEKEKSELTLASERYLKNLRGINEQPLGGGHREWLRGIVNRARDILAGQGHNLTNADLQAIWWYPEKELYSRLGGVDSEALNTDYASAFKDLKARRAIAAQGAPK